jgi:DNA-binding transcriptional regulator YiaG
MSKLGKELISAIKDADKRGLVTLKATPDIAVLRKELHLSQLQFAKIYCINPETLKKWEQHRRVPDSVSRAYLKCIAEQPKVVARLVHA